MRSAQYVIIGAGFAGAATAYQLARRGAKEIILLEQEATAGVHSSGQNAAMVRQVVADPWLLGLTREGAAFVDRPPSDWPTPIDFRRNGSLLLASEGGWNRLSHDAQVARETGIEVECWPAERAREHVPLLKDADFAGALWCPTDGVVDIHALLAGFLKAASAAGVEIRYRSRLRSIEVTEETITGVSTETETIKTTTVVNAAGAWAGAMGALAGAVKIPLRVCRRHLFVTAPLSWVNPGWPFVWHVTHDLYFRPEAGGLLMCPCDQDEMAPGSPPTDGAIAELLAEKVNRHLPQLSNVAIKHTWAGLRTLSPDGRFVIGWDPKVKGFFWVAGMGGHGVTTSSSVGALAAKLILDDPGEAPEFCPSRFLP